MTTQIKRLFTLAMPAVAAAFVMFGSAAPASASITRGLTVTSIETGNGSVFVHFDGNLSGASCSNKNMLYFSGTTSAGKNWLAQLTAAFLGAKTVAVDFNSTCTSNTHNMKWMHLYN